MKVTPNWQGIAPQDDWRFYENTPANQTQEKGWFDTAKDTVFDFVEDNVQEISGAALTKARQLVQEFVNYWQAIEGLNIDGLPSSLKNSIIALRATGRGIAQQVEKTGLALPQAEGLGVIPILVPAAIAAVTVVIIAFNRDAVKAINQYKIYQTERDRGTPPAQAADAAITATGGNAPTFASAFGGKIGAGVGVVVAIGALAYFISQDK